MKTLAITFGLGLTMALTWSCSGGDAPAPGASQAQSDVPSNDAGAQGAKKPEQKTPVGNSQIAEDAAAAPKAKLVINEVFPGGDAKDLENPTDWVEVKNLGTEVVDLAGYVLVQGHEPGLVPEADDSIYLTGSLEAGAYLVFTTSSDDVPADGSFGVSGKKPEKLTLLDASGRIVDETTTDASDDKRFESGTSWGRSPDGEGAFARIQASRGTKNPVPADGKTTGSQE